jgi:uncharacterized protein
MTNGAAEDDPPLLKVARETINKGDLAAFKAYIEAKPDRLNAFTPFGTWLHWAIMRGQPDIAKYLIAARLDVNENSGISDSNSLDFAASEGDLEMVKYVRAKGAIFDTSEPTRNPLLRAIYGGHKHIVKYLLDNGIDHPERKRWDCRMPRDYHSALQPPCYPLACAFYVAHSY